MLAGILEVQLLANMARLQSDMDAAKRYVGDTMGSIDRMAGAAKMALGSLGGVLSAGAFIGWVNGAIEAADSTNDLSKSTGLAVEQLAGLKLAARQSGADLEGTAQAINKLSTKIGENAEKYAKIGVTAKEPMEAFKQLADVYAKIDDPQLRAAFGAEALSKNWAAAAPLLAEGSAGIQAMVDKGARLSGMTQEAADQADQFNDRMAELQMISEAAALGIAKDVLPILTAVAEGMIESKGSTEDLAGAFPKLSEVLRTFVIFGGNVMFVLKAIGTEIGGIAAQAAAVASGNFKMAGDIGDMMKEDAVKARAAFDEWESKMLSAGTAAVETSKKAEGATGKLTAAQTAALKLFASTPTAKAKSAAETAYETFAADAAKREALLTAEAGGVAKLTDAEKWALETMVKVRDGKLGQSAAERTLIASRVESILALEKLNAEEERSAAAMARHADAVGADQTTAQGIIDANTALREQTAELGLSSTALEALKQSRIDDKIAAETWRLGLLGGVDASGAQADAIRETIAALQDSKTALAENEAAQRAADAIKAQGEVWKSIDDTARQTFVSIWDSGKSSFDRLKDTLKNGLYDLLYQMTVKKWIVQIATSVSGESAAQSAFGSAAASGIESIISGLFSSTASGTGAGSAAVGSLWGAQVALPSFAVGTDYVPQDMIAQIHKGEKITPAAYNKDGGEGDRVTVNVINNASGTQATQTQRADGNGGSIIDVMIDTVKGAIVKDIGTGGSVAGAMESQYGLNRAARAWT